MNGKLRNMTAIYLTANGKILMLYRVGSRVVAPSWCGIGGHFEKGELNDARAAALRELEEETGLQERDISDMALRYVTLRRKNDEIRQNYYFFAELREDAVLPESCDEGILEWVELDSLLDREMPFTAKHMLAHYLHTGKHTNLLYCGAAKKNGVEFAVLEEF